MRCDIWRTPRVCPWTSCFLVYINNIISNIQSEIRSFADDVFIYKTIKMPDDHQILQNGLNLLVKWSIDWKMDFSISKCKILQIITHCNKSVFTYQMLNVPLKIVLERNYLGIRLHHKLSWEIHISYICNKANRFPGFLKKTYAIRLWKLKNTSTNNRSYHPVNIVVPSGTLTIKQVSLN